VAWGGHDDLALFNPLGSAVDDTLDTDARMAFVRRAGGEPVRWLMAEGTRLEHGGRVLLQFGAPASGALDGATLVLDRHDVSFEAWAPFVTAVRGPHGVIPFVRDGDRIVSADPTDAAGPPGAGHRVELEDIVPNPFNPGATLRLRLESAAAVRLRLFDARGRLVRTLHDGPLAAGRHALVWDGADERGRARASGVYLAEMSAAGLRQTRKLVLVR
jgi:hypothetical protein